MRTTPDNLESGPVSRAAWRASILSRPAARLRPARQTRRVEQPSSVSSLSNHAPQLSDRKRLTQGKRKREESECGYEAKEKQHTDADAGKAWTRKLPVNPPNTYLTDVEPDFTTAKHEMHLDLSRGKSRPQDQTADVDDGSETEGEDERVTAAQILVALSMIPVGADTSKTPGNAATDYQLKEEGRRTGDRDNQNEKDDWDDLDVEEEEDDDKDEDDEGRDISDTAFSIFSVSIVPAICTPISSQHHMDQEPLYFPLSPLPSSMNYDGDHDSQQHPWPVSLARWPS